MTYAVAMTPTSTPSTNSAARGNDAKPGGLFEHRSRREWGLATRVHHGVGRIAYQFEDGRLRRIAASHAHLMDRVDRPRDESERLERKLAAAAGATLARQSLRDAGEEIVTLDEQLRLFRHDFEDGFDDPSFVKNHRGSGPRRAKRHRDPAIRRADELLSRDQMMLLIVASRHDVVLERVAELLRGTSLVTKRQLEALDALDEDGVRRAAATLCDLLYGDVDVARAMQAWIDALASGGRGVSWSLATAVPALLQPHRHFAVLPSVLTHQARWLAPRLRMNSVPSGKLYARLRSMALRLRDELHTRGQAPRDLFDVYDFVWLTLRPAARKRIATLPPAAPVSHVRAIVDRGDSTLEDGGDTVAA